MSFLFSLWNFTDRDKLKQYYGLRATKLNENECKDAYEFLSKECKIYQGLDGNDFYHFAMLKAIEEKSISTIAICMDTPVFVHNFECYCLKVIEKNNITIFNLFMAEGPDINLNMLALEIVARNSVEFLKCLLLFRPNTSFTYRKALTLAVRENKRELVNYFCMFPNLDIHPGLETAIRLNDIECVSILCSHPKISTGTKNLECFELALSSDQERIAILLLKTRTFYLVTDHITTIVNSGYLKLFQRILKQESFLDVKTLSSIVLFSYNINMLKALEKYCRNNACLEVLYLSITIQDHYIAMSEILEIGGFNPDELLLLCGRNNAPKCLQMLCDEIYFSDEGVEKAVREQFVYQHTDCLNVMISDGRFPLNIDEDNLFLECCRNGNDEIVSKLLLLPIINPLVKANEALKLAIRNKKYSTLQLLVKTGRYTDFDGSCKKLCDRLYDEKAYTILHEEGVFLPTKTFGRERFYSF